MLDRVTEKTPHSRGLFFLERGWRELIVPCVVLLACLMPFLPGLSGPFVLDDTVNLERVIVADASFEAVYGATFENDSGPTGRPISNLSFIANQLLGGYQPFGYKLVNLGIHLSCGILVFLLARRLLPLLRPDRAEGQDAWIALGAAVLWTVHPLQVSTVLYVVQRMTQLAALFMLLAVLIAIKPLLEPAALPRARDGFRHACVVGLVAILAVLSKENGALVPFLLLAIAMALPKPMWQIASDSTGKKTFWGVAVAAPVAIAVALCFVFWSWLTAGFAFRDFTVGERLLSQPPILAGYLKSFFLPDLRDMGLFLDDARVYAPADPVAWVGVGAVVLVLVGAWLLRKRLPMFAFAVFWFAAAHLLESTFTSLELAFEHRNYIALFGPCLLLATGVAKLGEMARPRVAGVVAAAIVLTFGALTLQRARVWGDPVTFYLTAATHHPDSMRAQTGAAAMESQLGNNPAAIARIHAFRARHPHEFFPFAMDLDLACEIPWYDADWRGVEARIRANPKEIEVMSIYQAVGQKLLRGDCQGDIREEFITHVRKVSGIYRNADLGYFLQFFLALQANFEDSTEAARRLFQEAIALNPGDRTTLTHYAYFELNHASPKMAEVPIARLRTMTPRWHPASDEVSELEEFLKHATQAGSTESEG